jgi:hypothetical protein
VVFLAGSWAALAGGLFPEHVLPPHLVAAWSNPPALQVLLAAQAAMVIAFGPLVVGRRIGAVNCREPAGVVETARATAGHPRPRGRWRGALVLVPEYGLCLAACVPLYVIAAWVSDATPGDVLRGTAYLTAVAVGACGLGLWASTGRATLLTAVALVGILAAVGAPVLAYLLAEMANLYAGVEWLRWAAPTTCAYSLSASRLADWSAAPTWSWFFWPGAAVILGLARLLVRA